LRQLGVELSEYDDGVDVTGLATTAGKLHGGTVDAHGDHRIAMSMAVLGMRAAAPVVIEHAEEIATSYPQFVEQMNQLGADLQWQ
jgi:3-phosphoshikimate 1-carboxyvinyltransferase